LDIQGSAQWVPRRAAFCHFNKQRFATLLEAVGQFGVAVSEGVEIVAAVGQLVYEAGGILLTVDGSNAFNAVSHSAVLAEVAQHVPDLYPYAAQIYGVGSVWARGVALELYNVSKTPRCFGGTTATVGTVPTTANIDGV
jgi:hypothetical protein